MRRLALYCRASGRSALYCLACDVNTYARRTEAKHIHMLGIQKPGICIGLAYNANRRNLSVTQGAASFEPLNNYVYSIRAGKNVHVTLYTRCMYRTADISALYRSLDSAKIYSCCSVHKCEWHSILEREKI